MVWPWLVYAMTGGRCQRKKKMMGRGKDGGCGTEVKPCPISRASANALEDNDKSNSDSERAHVGLDFFTQASKALSERSPFETKEFLDSGVPHTLPSSLATFYVKHADSRKRRKKSSHSGGGGKTKKSSRSDRSRAGTNIWVETEEYFRDLTLPDIEELYKASSFGFLDSQSCFLIPSLGNVIGSNASSSGNAILSNFSSRRNGVDINVSSSGNAVEVGLDNGVVVKEGDKSEESQLMEIDTVNANDSTKKEEENFTPSNSLEWLLGVKSRILLTSERPSKKRKLLGPDAGLKKLIVNPPPEGNVSVCDFCSLGDTGEQLNKLIVCNSCKVVVHQKCYGMQEEADGLWLCSWCKQRSEREDGGNASLWPCDLCPKKGGALKPVHKSLAESENGGSTRFSHLFCSLWMPEVYVDDTKVMEPIMNIEGIKETRRKLVCNVCKVKCGACIRCSNGACRTSFHPICAREARHRMEIWGKSVHDNVELRAFCSKHSRAMGNVAIKPSHDQSMAIDSITEPVPVTSSVIKPSKLKFGRRNGDKIVLHVETNETKDLNSDKLGGGTIEDVGLVVTRSNSGLEPEHGNGQQLIDMEKLDRNTIEDSKQSDRPNLASILHKLIDRGKVNMKDIASEIGISLDLLVAAVTNGCLGLDSQCKIIKWLKDHAYIGWQQNNNLRYKRKSAAPFEAEIDGMDDIDAVTVAETDLADVVPVKSVPPRRRTKSNIRILKDNKILSSKKVFTPQSNDGAMVHGGDRDAEGSEKRPNLKKNLDCETTEKILTLEPTVLPGVTNLDVHLSEDNLVKPLDCSTSQSAWADLGQNKTTNSDQNPACSVDPPFNQKAVYNSCIHPLIRNKLMQVRLGLNMIKEFDDAEERKLASSEASSVSTVNNYHKNQHCNRLDVNAKCGQPHLGQLVKAGKGEILELSPEDEVENELVYFQHKLLENAVARKCFSDALMCKVVQSLPMEIDAGRKQQWDNVFANRYLCELKEAKKRGRKERRHQEAQAVLAALAAAAASSRLSSFRKDVLDESAHQESMLKASPGRVGSYSQLMPRAKEMLPKLAVGRVSSEKQSDFVLSSSDFSKEHSRCCDICRRSETLWNPLLVCCGCKVSVHLDCYSSTKESAGPWYCELCEELLSSKSSIALAGNSREKPYFPTECCVCGGNMGAFRKSTEGQWIHAFCAEWVFESTFRRGQVNPIEGMETAPKGNDVCCICHRQFGVCIKCNFGHCHSTFHPACARNAGFFMHIKTGGDKLQHKAYCEKHSSEQRSKIETHKHGAEELKSIKQVRVELERLRLICERIAKREKLKRELALCSHDILASKRDSVALSMLARTPCLPPDVSSESATTSLRGHTDGYRSCSEAVQRSDDVTVDSTLSGKRCVKLSMSMDIDQKTDDSSTSEQPVTHKPIGRTSYSGKHIPHRSSSAASRNQMDEWEKRSKPRKHTETFEKELVMTSDQASMKNQRLPKGFAYVPIERLSKEKQANEDASSCEPLENDG